MMPFGPKVTALKRQKWTLSRADITKIKRASGGTMRSTKDVAAAALADILGWSPRTVWAWKKRHLPKGQSEELRELAPRLEFFGVHRDVYCAVAALCSTMPRPRGLRRKIAALEGKAAVMAGPADEDEA